MPASRSALAWAALACCAAALLAGGALQSARGAALGAAWAPRSLMSMSTDAGKAALAAAEEARGSRDKAFEPLAAARAEAEQEAATARAEVERRRWRRRRLSVPLELLLLPKAVLELMLRRLR